MSQSRTMHRCRDVADLAEQAADAFLAVAEEAIRERGRFVVALSGGNTPRRLHALLATPPRAERLDWSRVEFFWGDERTVPPDDPDSNYRMARESLLEPLGIAADQVYRMAAEREDGDAAARDYAEQIAACFQCATSNAPPSFDLVLLGMGDDGHTASLFPGTAALEETTRWVVANSVPQHATTRLTMTYPLLNSARAVIFLVSGASKAAVLSEVLHGAADPQRLPSQGIQPIAGRLEWFVDAAAAANLPVEEST